MDYDLIICFETHVELKTATKLFCNCAVKYGAHQNSEICPVCTGQPGALPVLNKQAVEFAVRAGLALNCEINRYSRFARKNYFYPDLPKGYQISQYELPFCENGCLEIPGDNGEPYPVGIKRIHLEEDAGKLVHSAASFDEADYSLVDLNRSSVPLLEIVCDHERNPMHSLQQARAYLEKLRQILRYIEISDCSMELGQMRCDVNISIRPKGSRQFGNRAEIKNMSSFRFINEALEYEIKRQKEILESGGEVVQETRLFDETRKLTLPMRSKEDAPDYRYFPDPDLVEVELDESYVEKIRDSLPELPDQRVKRIIDQYQISQSDALILTKDRSVADYFTACAPHTKNSQKLIRWIIKDLFTLLNESSQSIQECQIQPKDFARLVNLVVAGDITEKIGQTVLNEMFKTGGLPDEIIEKRGLKPIQDTTVLEKIIDELLVKNPDVIESVKAGNKKPVDFLIGQVMRETRGKANPKVARELTLKKLGVGSD